MKIEDEMKDMKLFNLRMAYSRIKSQCWIDRDGKCYWLDVKKFCQQYDCDVANAICIHSIILDQIDEGYNYGHDYYSKLGWIPYGSLCGQYNRCGIEPNQAQLNTMYGLRGLQDKWEKILRY
jgi:hypothetical protein